MSRADLATLDAIQANVALLDRAGVIISVNGNWRRFGEENGLLFPNAGVGFNYLEVCRKSDAPRELIENLSDLLAGRLTVFSHWYPCHAPNRKRWFVLLAFRNIENGSALLIHLEVTELISAQTLNQIEFEKPDHFQEHRLQLGVQAELIRLMPTVVAQVRKRYRLRARTAKKRATTDFRSKLTDRQIEIFEYLGSGMSNAEIADQLGISPNTAKLHVSAILKRLGLRTRAEAVAMSGRKGDRR